MKNLLSKPKIIIPIVTIVVLVCSLVLYKKIGVPPTLAQSLLESSQKDTADIIAPGTNIALGFPKAGKVEAVLFKEGDTVKAGQVVARLSAPDALGAVNQAKGALDVAEAQYASLNKEYVTTKKQQDLMVENAYKTLLSSGLQAVPNQQDTNTPAISGSYTCGTEGTYSVRLLSAGAGSSISYEGLEKGFAEAGITKYDNPVALGTCGLQLKFNKVPDPNYLTTWTIDIPNTKSTVYLTNKNAYDLAVENRTKVLEDLSNKIGSDSNASVAKAQIDAARGAYQAALGSYQNNVIIAPTYGVVTFVDKDLKVGQTVAANKSVISISAK